ncbi:uncharacterized protein LOC116802089 [Drosophila sechellia]|uniref:uncharacterized protein LOC116802089 n=1 Tax=Drosophila sechellia TaxID=7238 RepID=UPI0013DDBE0D|nr:uncharacterized protein LOC116802089 [Drosophila sechellia]
MSYPRCTLRPMLPSSRRGCRNSSPAAPKEPKKPPVRTELPSGWETMHPATILCIMRPGLSYSDYGSSGDNTTGMQHLGITVDNQEFHAHADPRRSPVSTWRESVQLSVRHKLRLRRHRLRHQLQPQTPTGRQQHTSPTRLS